MTVRHKLDATEAVGRGQLYNVGTRDVSTLNLAGGWQGRKRAYSK